VPSGYIQPSPYNTVDNIVLGEVGISMCFKTSIYKEYGIKMKPVYAEDYLFFRDIMNAKFKVKLSKSITYRVRPQWFENPQGKLADFSGIDCLLYINLDSAKNRNILMLSQMPDNIPYIRCPAVNGYKYNLPTLNKLTRTEVACTLSHMKAMKMLLSMKGDTFIICEDDVEFLPSTKIKDVIHNAPDFEILKIQYIALLDMVPFGETEYRKYDVKNIEWGSAGYIIKRQAILKLLKLFSYSNINVPDITLFTFLNTYTARIPSMNNTYYFGSSLVRNEKGSMIMSCTRDYSMPNQIRYSISLLTLSDSSRCIQIIQSLSDNAINVECFEVCINNTDEETIRFCKENDINTCLDDQIKGDFLCVWNSKYTMDTFSWDKILNLYDDDYIIRISDTNLSFTPIKNYNVSSSIECNYIQCTY
jgi:GR25 family glycosyltransferase involved in LPS biosynthesis